MDPKKTLLKVYLILLFLIILILNIKLISAEDNIDWIIQYDNVLDEDVFHIISTFDGNFLILESILNDSKDVYLSKIDSLGKKIWSKKLGGDQDDECYSIKELSNGNLILVGRTHSFDSIWDDVLIYMLNKNGVELWHKRYGNVFWEWGESLVQTHDGFIILGSTNYMSKGKYDMLLLKIDFEGNKLWSKTIGGSDDDWGKKIIKTNDDCFIILGYTKSFGAGDNDILLVKVNSNGDEIWEKTIGYEGDDRGYDIAYSYDGGFVITGSTNSFGADRRDVFLLKVDFDGNLIWKRNFGGAYDDCGYSLREWDEGNIVIVGDTFSFGSGSSDAYLIVTDNFGNLIFNYSYGGNRIDKASSVVETPDQGILVVGTETIDSHKDVLLIKFKFKKHNLFVSSRFGKTTGSGYYLAESLATCSVDPIIITAGKETRYVFDGWYVNYSSKFLGSENPLIYEVNNDAVITALWKKQHRLKIYSDFGTHLDTWLDENKRILLTAPEIEGFRFKSWDGTGSGCYIGSDEATTIMIQGPIIQEAIYEEIPTYTLSIHTPYGEASGEGAYPEDSVVTFSVYPTIIDETNSTRQVFSEWISLNPLGYSGIENPAKISLKCDLTEVANWKTQHYVHCKLEEGGKSTSSSGWFDEGTIITLSATSMDDYIFQSWMGGGPGSYTGNEKEHTIIVNGPITQTAVFKPKPSYSLSIVSDFGAPFGVGDYVIGSNVIFGISPNIVEMEEGERYVFNGWISENPGGYNGNDNPAQIIIYNNIIEEVSWKKQYYIDVNSPASIDIQGWYDEDTEINLNPHYKGFLIREILKYSSNNLELKHDKLDIIVKGPLIIYAEWVVDFSRVYLLFSVITVTVAGLSYKKHLNRIKIFREKEFSLLNKINEKGLIIFPDFVNEFSYDINFINKIIEDNINEKRLFGIKTYDGLGFITLNKLRELTNMMEFNLNEIMEKISLINFNKINKYNINKFEALKIINKFHLLSIKKVHVNKYEKIYELSKVYDLKPNKFDLKEIRTYDNVNFIKKSYEVSKKILEYTPKNILAFDISSDADEMIFIAPTLFPEELLENYRVIDGAMIPSKLRERDTPSLIRAEPDYHEYDNEKRDTMELSVCPYCSGTGQRESVEYYREDGQVRPVKHFVICPYCNGKKFVRIK